MPAEFLGDAGVPLRRELCREFRRTLVQHPDQATRPRVRSNTGAISLAPSTLHDGAYLQHDAHASLAVAFFLERSSEAPRSVCKCIRLRVFRRWDCSSHPPEEATLASRSAESDSVDDITLQLYSNSGHGYIGYHYDPVFAPRLPTINTDGAETPRGEENAAASVSGLCTGVTALATDSSSGELKDVTTQRLDEDKAITAKNANRREQEEKLIAENPLCISRMGLRHPI
jgi:hypothetical protein